MIYIDKLWQSINETNQESNYLQFCRSKTDCQFRIHCLLEAVCYLTFSSTRPPPAVVCPLQVKFELQLTQCTKSLGFIPEILGSFHYGRKSTKTSMVENQPKFQWLKTNQNFHGWKPTKISMVENQPKLPWLKTNQNFHGWKPTKISMVESQPKCLWQKGSQTMIDNQNAYATTF